MCSWGLSVLARESHLISYLQQYDDKHQTNYLCVTQPLNFHVKDFHKTLTTVILTTVTPTTVLLTTYAVTPTTVTSTTVTPTTVTSTTVTSTTVTPTTVILTTEPNTQSQRLTMSSLSWQ